MTVENGGRDANWAQNMTMTVRLKVPTGLNAGWGNRRWYSTTKSDLNQYESYTFDDQVQTDSVASGADDWVLVVKYVWDRRFPAPDIVKTERFSNIACLKKSRREQPGQ